MNTVIPSSGPVSGVVRHSQRRPSAAVVAAPGGRIPRVASCPPVGSPQRSALRASRAFPIGGTVWGAASPRPHAATSTTAATAANRPPRPIITLRDCADGHILRSCPIRLFVVPHTQEKADSVTVVAPRSSAGTPRTLTPFRYVTTHRKAHAKEVLGGIAKVHPHYQLGIDLGTTWTAASICREGDARP